MATDMPDGRGLDRLEWERGASYGWKYRHLPNGKEPSQSFIHGFEYGMDRAHLKSRAEANDEMFAGGDPSARIDARAPRSPSAASARSGGDDARS